MEKKDALDILYDELDDLLDYCKGKLDDTCDDEWLIWIRIPSSLWVPAHTVLEEKLNDYWYELVYHPDDDSVFANIVGDKNMEALVIDMMMANKIRQLFKNEDEE